MRFSPSQLEHPIVQAPLAGGPSTPALAAAVSEAGGLGFLGAGYRSAEGVREEIAELRRLTERPFGVNLFAPGPALADGDALANYASALAGEAERYGVAVLESEIVGLVPSAALNAAAEFYLQIEGFNAEQVLENKLSSLKSQG